LFYIKNICYSNNRNHYSTFVPPRKTLALSLCKTSASLARRITPAALQLSASAQFLRLYYPYFLPVSTVYRLTSCCPKTMPNHCSRNKKQTA